MDIKTFINHQSNLDTLRFLTCGSVDDGKSTLIGRILYESKVLYDDQINALNKTKTITSDDNTLMDFASLVDGLSDEIEQGITIDVAYRFFSTNKRKFIIADTPGHEQYTRNMITGASTSDLAIILVNAKEGLLEQTKRHAILCSLLGIKYIVLAINKIDLIKYDKKLIKKIENDFKLFSKTLEFETVEMFPISALHGDNIINHSPNTPWYRGNSLIGFLEEIEVYKNKNEYFRFNVQSAIRYNSNFRGYSGQVISGQIKSGEEIKVLPSEIKAKIKKISLYKNTFEIAQKGMSLLLEFDKEIDISRGDYIVEKNLPHQISDQFQITIIWLDKNLGYAGRLYKIKIGGNLLECQIIQLKYKININNLEKQPLSKLEMNDVATINIKINKKITFDTFKNCKNMGCGILIDKISNNTVAACMIDFSLYRGNNIYLSKSIIDKKMRQNLNGHVSKVLWLTGLSGSGKSTIARELDKSFHTNNIRSYILDGDNIRHGISKDLGFTNQDRIENIRRNAEIAKLMVDAGVVTIVALISPFASERSMARSLFNDEEFIEIFVDTELEVAETRDVKGLYKKARRGEITNFTGISSPYEKPIKPEIHLITKNKKTSELVEIILSYINLEIFKT